jgi:hypothetical protein
MSHRREDGTFEPLGDETPDERKRRLTGARADALLADPAALRAWVARHNTRWLGRSGDETTGPACHSGR